MAGFHDFRLRAIDGSQRELRDYRGKVCLVVNVASKCGLTPQYDGLQRLYDRFQDRGLEVLGFPCNQFAGQEPGSEAEIKDFCERNFQVSFPLTAKEKVIGGNAHPFYKWIAAELGEDAAPRWNFHKYLIDGEGNPAEAWPSKVEPGSKTVTSAVERLLPA